VLRRGEPYFPPAPGPHSTGGGVGGGTPYPPASRSAPVVRDPVSLNLDHRSSGSHRRCFDGHEPGQHPTPELVSEHWRFVGTVRVNGEVPGAHGVRQVSWLAKFAR
jgi:hypothetical protein